MIAREITAEVSAPSGFAVELGTAFTVLFCAKLGELAQHLSRNLITSPGIPVSSTHCAVGAVVFVGMSKSTSEGVSWRAFTKVTTRPEKSVTRALQICVVWLLCFPISAVISFFCTWLLYSFF